jgi:hypothetical protein
MGPELVLPSACRHHTGGSGEVLLCRPLLAAPREMAGRLLADDRRRRRAVCRGLTAIGTVLRQSEDMLKTSYDAPRRRQIHRTVPRARRNHPTKNNQHRPLHGLCLGPLTRCASRARLARRRLSRAFFHINTKGSPWITAVNKTIIAAAAAAVRALLAGI